MIDSEKCLTVKEASVWATKHIGKTVTPSNITYLINYGRILKTRKVGTTLIPEQELIDYYKTYQSYLRCHQRARIGGWGRRARMEYRDIAAAN